MYISLVIINIAQRVDQEPFDIFMPLDKIVLSLSLESILGMEFKSRDTFIRLSYDSCGALALVNEY